MRAINIEESDFQAVTIGIRSRFELWELILTVTQVEVMAEIGVWKGSFAGHVLERCETIERYYMIDPWANLPNWNKPYNIPTEEFNEIYQEAMERTEFAASRRVVLRDVSKEALTKIPAESLDFGYIDGDHTLRGITIDLIKLFPKIKDGGLIGGDDFKLGSWWQSGNFEPTLVCPFSVYFAEAYDLPIVALPFNQFVIQKKKDSTFAFVDLTGQYGDLSLAKHSFQSNVPAMKKRAKRLLSKLGLRM